MSAPVVVDKGGFGGGLRTGPLVLLLIICAPIGLVLTLFSNWKKETKLAVFGIYLVIFLFVVLGQRH